MIRADFDDSSGNPETSECDKMTVMTLPKKMQNQRRAEAAHSAPPAAKHEPVVKRNDAGVGSGEENCPVIRANHIVFSSGRTGRTRVVFY
jgi:hypothetical protein